MRYLLPLALLLSAAAQSAPVANLALACPDESAIGRPFDDCRGYAYQVPTNQLIVATGSFASAIWRRASDLGNFDPVLVCTIPVEPGYYSSCRDATGLRRMAFVSKYVLIKPGNRVTVSKTGGDYTDPVTAAANAYAGDTWCVAPQWPDQPCVMAIGEGTFILGKTLSIADGLAVSGIGKGDTMLVADNGVETAVSSLGNVRFSDLTIVNSQAGGGRTTGLNIQRSHTARTLIQLQDVAIHVSDAAQNVALVRGDSVEIVDSEITAVGQDTTGISNLNPGPPDVGTHVTLERSFVSAETAIYEEFGSMSAPLRLIDSRVFGRVFFDHESALDIIGTEIIGDVTAHNDFVRVVISDSSIKGNAGFFAGSPVGGPSSISMTNTSIEGSLTSGSSATFDGLSIQGQFVLHRARASVRGSYLIDSASTAPALSLRGGANVELEQTFVQGAQALAVEANSRLAASSSVLAGPVSGAAGAVLRCTDTYGADYELLSELCQPQTP